MTVNNAALKTKKQDSARNNKRGKADTSSWPDLSKLKADDTVSMYMKEMAQTPLLDHAQEKELGKQITRGRLAAEKLKNESVSGQEAEMLQEQVEESQKARNQLVKANTRLVVSVVKRYVGQGVPISDLIQGGNLGLMRAAEKYDYSRGYRFSTYATWWIRQGVTRTLANQRRTIRIPLHTNDRILSIRALSGELEKNWGRKPTIEELARELEIEPSTVNFLLKAGQNSLSLDAPVGSEEEASAIGDFIENENIVNPVDKATHELLKEKIEDILLTLPPREARILRERFGLYDGKIRTLKEVGEKFGLTRERIRQLENVALRKLRHPSRARYLKEYWI